MINKDLSIPNHSFDDLGIHEQMAMIAKFGQQPYYDFQELHSHQFIDVLVFRKGGGTHTIDFNPFPIKDFSVHVVSVNSLHQTNRNQDSDGFSILITPFYLEQLQKFDNTQPYLEYFSKSKIIEFDEHQFDEFEFIFEVFQQEQMHRSYLLNMLAAFLSKLINKSSVETSFNLLDPVVLRFIAHLNKHLRTPDCIEHFISNEKISEVVLRRKINKSTGKTPNRLFMERVIMGSKSLLYSTDWSVKEIAFDLNFESESYFCRQFKKYENLTPLEFRQMSKLS